MAKKSHPGRSEVMCPILQLLQIGNIYRCSSNLIFKPD